MGLDWKAVLWFVAIVASIPFVLWLVKRSPWLGPHVASGTARTVAVLPLSASQRLVTVEVGRGEDKLWLVLGVTASSITTVHTMAALPALPDSAGEEGHGQGQGSTAATFAQLLGRIRGAGEHHHGR